jgi:hypothetical protein
VRKARRAGALYGGRKPGHGRLKPLGSRDLPIARSEGRKGREGREDDRDVLSGVGGGRSPKGHKAQESKRPRPDLNRWGSRRGHGFFGGSKPLEPRHQAGKVWWEKAGAEEEKGNLFFRSPKRRKALKGEAQEWRELKEAL